MPHRLASRWVHALPSGSCLVGQDCRPDRGHRRAGRRRHPRRRRPVHRATGAGSFARGEGACRPRGTPPADRITKLSASRVSAERPRKKITPSPAVARQIDHDPIVRRDGCPTQSLPTQQFPPSPKVSVESPRSCAQTAEKAAKFRLHHHVQDVSGNCRPRHWMLGKPV